METTGFVTVKSSKGEGSREVDVHWHPTKVRKGLLQRYRVKFILGSRQGNTIFSSMEAQAVSKQKVVSDKEKLNMFFEVLSKPLARDAFRRYLKTPEAQAELVCIPSSNSRTFVVRLSSSFLYLKVNMVEVLFLTVRPGLDPQSCTADVFVLFGPQGSPASQA